MLSWDMDSALQGKLLIAMPSLTDGMFSGSVIVMCAHSAEGAMGLIINKSVPGMSFLDLADQINMGEVSQARAEALSQLPVLMGGPVDQQRGFVLHSPDYQGAHTLKVNDALAVTSTLDILQSLALGQGPGRYLLALGYSGWSPGQLESEILRNGWLHSDIDIDLIFSGDHAAMYARALHILGVDPANLSTMAGHA
jgi:putative transcriptional regulator